ncbi:MAG: endonuclease III [Candidatus Micrarchaeia archaeon]
MDAKTKSALELLRLMKRCTRNETHLASRRKNPFQVLIATVLSQRTRDENTNAASNALFAKYDSPQKLADAPIAKIEKLARPAGFYRQKAKRIKAICKILVEKFGGSVPKKLEQLLELPGVGRKTANCVLVYGFGIPAVPVDVHVHRLSNLFGLVKTRTPEETEFTLAKIIPKSHWLELNETFVRFGQQVCRPGMNKRECLAEMKKRLKAR